MRHNKTHFSNKIEINHNNEGLTLIELMIVLVLSMVLMAAAYMSYQVQSASSKTQSRVSLMQQDLRVAMFNLSKDIRNAGCDHLARSDIAMAPLVATSNSSGEHRLTINMDLTGYADGRPDGFTDDSGEHILYRLNGTNLERIDINDSNKVLQIAQNVQDFLLEYFSIDSATGTLTPITAATLPGNEDDVRVIRISISIESPDPSNPGQTLTRYLRRDVKLRNIYDPNI